MREILDELLKREDVDKSLLEDITSDAELIKDDYCPDYYTDVDCQDNCCEEDMTCEKCWRRSLGLDKED